jgi:hypothetical protein
MEGLLIDRWPNSTVQEIKDLLEDSFGWIDAENSIFWKTRNKRGKIVA